MDNKSNVVHAKKTFNTITLEDKGITPKENIYNN